MVLEKQLIILSNINASPSMLLALLFVESTKLYFSPAPSWDKWKLILKPKDFCLEFDAASSKAGLKTTLLMSVSRSLLGARIGMGRKMPAKFMDKRDFWALNVFLSEAESPFLILNSMTATGLVGLRGTFSLIFWLWQIWETVGGTQCPITSCLYPCLGCRIR